MFRAALCLRSNEDIIQNMKFKFFICMLATCVAFKGTQAAPKATSWSWPQTFDKVWASGNGTRIVLESPSFADTDKPIQIYNASSGRQLGYISRARQPIAQQEGEDQNIHQRVSVRAISSDGQHLIVQQWLLAQDKIVKDSYVEMWNIAQKPRIEWRKRSPQCLDVRYSGKQIVVLGADELQRWSVRGKLLSRLRVAGSSDANTLSSDGTYMVINTTVSTIMDTRTGRVLQTLKLPYPDQPVSWMIGPKNLFVWGHTLTPDEGFAPWDNFAIWRLRDGKCFNVSLQNIVFSPDGSAFWDIQVRRFRTIATSNIAPIPVPKAFAQNEAFLQAVSDDGRVWAGRNRKGQIFWTVERKARKSTR